MNIINDPTVPIYLQIAEQIEDHILNKNILEEEQVYSTNQLARTYQINPATAAKGLNLLVDEGILCKKRGIGMFVTTGAIDYIRKKRKATFYKEYIMKMIKEGEKLNISKEEIIKMIEQFKGE